MGQSWVRQLSGLTIALVVVALPKSLYAVDGVIEINQAKAVAGGVTPGDGPGFPVSIDTGTFAADSMCFRLTGPLFTSTSGTVIEITSPGVTLDLNGFMITCLLPSCNGTAIHTTQDNVTIRNGTIRGFNVGIDMSAAKGSRVDNIRAVNNTGNGIVVGSESVVNQCIATNNGGNGIDTQSGAIVTNNLASLNGGSGICTIQGCTVIGNNVFSNTSYGLNLSTTTAYGNNVITSNGMTVHLGVQMGPNMCNGSTTCP